MKKILSILLSCFVFFVGCLPREIHLAKKCQKSTVLIHVKVLKNDKKMWGTCSGVYVNPKVILTANHCIDSSDGAEILEIWVRNFDNKSMKAEVIKKDFARDLALLKTDLRGIPVKLARNVRVGEDVWIIGNPLGLEFVVSKGIVSNVDLSMKQYPINHFITTAIVLPGSSGGPTFNAKGQLVGIEVMSTSMVGSLGASGLGIVVQIDEVRNFLRMK